ncbi:MAG: methylamine utilization protein [Pseudomonadota bacterium]
MCPKAGRPARRLCLHAAMLALGLGFGMTSAWAETLQAKATDKDGNPMQDVVIYAMPVGGVALPASNLPPATISQEGMQFTPYVTAVKAGTEVKFPNLDKMPHHVKSFSSAKEFEYKVYEKGTPPPVVFDKSGVVIVYCLFHGWMRAYVMVVDTPYFAKTDDTGVIKLDGLTKGDYEIKAWHPDMGAMIPALSQTIKVGDKGVPELKFNFSFIAKKRKPAKL